MRPDERDAAQAVRGFVTGRTFEDYLKDRMLRGAVERHIEIIGEAARKVGSEFRAAHPEIPWGPIVGQRNVLAHEYGEIKDDQLWVTATVHVPALIARLEPLIPPLPGD